MSTLDHNEPDENKVLGSHGPKDIDASAGYEQSDVKVTGIVVFLVSLFVFVGVCGVVTYGIGKLINAELNREDGPNSKWTTDADLSYTFMQHFTLTLGANNIFDTHPDKIANSASNPIYVLTGSTADGQVYPRLGGPFGINGGYYYVRVRVKY